MVHILPAVRADRQVTDAEVVITQRDGRIIRYLLADHPVSALLAQQQAMHEPHAR